MKQSFFGLVLILLLAGGSLTMTEVSLPWGGTTLDDAGPYSAETWQALYERLFAGDQAARGPLYSDQNGNYNATADGTDMEVDISPGAALVDGIVHWSDATEALTISASDPSLDRIDRIVLQADTSNGKVRLVVKAGTAAATPSPPSLNTDRSPYYEIPLWQVYVTAAATTIAQSDLTDERAYSNIPQRVYLEVVNKSGGALAVGDVVVWDNTNDRGVTTTTTKDDADVAGVVADVMAADAEGRICILGPHVVNVGAAVGMGEVLTTSTTAKQATNEGSNSIGRTLEATAGAGLVQAFVQVRAVYPSRDVIMDNGSYNNTSHDWEQVDTTNWRITLTTHGGPVRVRAKAGTSVTFSNSGEESTASIDVYVDGTRWGPTVVSGTTLGPAWKRVGYEGAIGDVDHWAEMTFDILVEGLAPGSHTFDLGWKVSAPSTGTAEIKSPVGSAWFWIFEAEEVIN